MSIKQYKKNGLSSKDANSESDALSCKVSVKRRLTRYIREAPASLCYATIAPVFPHLQASGIPLGDVLQYVYTVDTLRRFAKTLGYGVKSPALGSICDFMERCWRLESSAKLNGALCGLQRRWRGREKGKEAYVNTEDPITMEPLENIPIAHRWSYMDSKGHRYGFHASSLMHFIETQGAWNPYTREGIPEADMERLRTHISRLTPDEQTDFTVVWNSPRDAFADILYDYEKYGFYTNMDWFLKLTPMNIIDMYTLLNADAFIPKTLFRMDELETCILEDPESGAAYRLAREMREIIRDNHDYKFYIVCNIFVAMAKICPSIRRALPPWTQAGARAIT